ncbi:Plasmodium vivax Vir protein, putative [Plasmodium ovale]|uniref:Plasmodium vivax Vir protein, putative n=1 Tax=Plasmodium ovale TaxID=36330 RepID=A0A1C3KHZ9_PLAOA|nr:Plasmodium vivax Vir protein, putative [Plasmodium ovale]
MSYGKEESIFKHLYLFPERKKDFEEVTNIDGTGVFYNCYDLDKEYYDGDEKKCKQIFAYLNHLEKQYKSSYVPAGCKYLNYWLYCELIKDNVSSYNTLFLYRKFLDKYIEKIGDDPNICEGYIEDINEDIYNKVKKILELYERFNIFKDTKKSFATTHCTDAKECANTYSALIEECHKYGNTYFCEALDKL